jgi:trigger factor
LFHLLQCLPMQVEKKRLSDTKVQLNISADEKLLQHTKQTVLKKLAREVRVAGFRPGKVPPAIAEKNVNQSVLQAEFLDAALNELYVNAIQQVKLRPVAKPDISIKKFVPFTTVEFEATLEAVGEITLGDYKKLNLGRNPVKIDAEDVDEVVEVLRTRIAERKAVSRAAKSGDEVVIDFAGSDAKTKEPIAGADGKGYPLILGSDSFIPGFEANVVGMKAGEVKTFDLTFPKDYGVAALQSRNVTFSVTAVTVNEIMKPKLDDDFAAKAGPVKTVAELKADIKQQLEAEKQTQAERDFEGQLLERISENSEVAIPKVLVDEEIDRVELEEKQNLAYRGQTWQEHLGAEGVTAEEHREQKRTAAEQHVKAGLILTEIADRENMKVTPEELQIRLQLMKNRYQSDKRMQTELEKPENQRDIANRLLTEKTLEKLKSYTTSRQG